jgi:hypothetical protein
MPFGSEGIEPGIGLALSGGGLRATLFRIGTCWRLVELGILPKLARISSVSGGSIFAGVLATSWHALRADPSSDNYQRLVVGPLRRFCRHRWRTSARGLILSPIRNRNSSSIGAMPSAMPACEPTCRKSLLPTLRRNGRAKDTRSGISDNELEGQESDLALTAVQERI